MSAFFSARISGHVLQLATHLLEWVHVDKTERHGISCTSEAEPPVEATV